MGRLGTDALALACIAGGAALGGTATLGALEARQAERTRTEVHACGVVVAEAPRVVLSGHDRHPRFERPVPARIHVSRCGGAVTQVRILRRDGERVRVDEARAEAEAARMRAEVARARAEDARREVRRHRERVERERLERERGRRP